MIASPINWGMGHLVGLIIGAVGYELWLRNKQANNQGGP